MYERDTAAPGAAPRHFVDEAKPSRPAALERAVEIRYAVTHVMDAWPALCEELRHGTRRIARLEELDLDVAEREGDDRRTIGAFGTPRLEPEDVAIERKGGGDGRNGDADVRDAGA